MFKIWGILLLLLLTTVLAQSTKLETLHEVQHLKFSSHSSQPIRAVISPDGRFVVSSANDKIVIVWDRISGRGLHTLDVGGANATLLFSPNSKRLLTTSFDESSDYYYRPNFDSKVWDVDSGQLLLVTDPLLAYLKTGNNSPRLQPTGLTNTDVLIDNGIKTIGIDPPNKIIELPALEIHCEDTNKLSVQIPPFQRKLIVALSQPADSCGSNASVDFLQQPNGNLIAVETQSGYEMLTHSQAQLKALEFLNLEDFPDIANESYWTADGQFFITLRNKNVTIIWDAKNQSKRVIDGRLLAISDKHILSVWGEKPILWDSLAREQNFLEQDYGHPFLGAGFLPDNSAVAFYANENAISLFTLPKSRIEKSKELVRFGGQSLFEFVISANGQQIATVGAGNYLQIFEASALKLIKRIRLPEGMNRAYALAFTPDNKSVVLGDASAEGGSYDRISVFYTQAFYVLDLTTEKIIASNETQRPHLGFVRSLVFSPDGSKLAVGYSNSQAVIFNTTTWQELHLLFPSKNYKPGFVMGLTWRPDGTELATSMGDGAVRLWDTNTGAMKTALRGHIGFVRAIAYSSDGKSLASVGADKTVRFWNLASKTAKVLREHKNVVSSLVWGADNVLLSADTTGIIIFWDTTSNTVLHRFKATNNTILNLRFAPDNKSLWVSSRDSLRRFTLVGNSPIIGGLK